MRRTLIAIPLALLALIAALGVWGVTLPREHRSASRVVIAAPPEAVYAVMRDLGTMATWWPEIERITPIVGNDGWERWTETMDGFEVTFIVAEEEPPFRFITRIEGDEDAAFGGTWTYEALLARGGGATVTVTEEGWVKNPYFRVMMTIGGPHTTLDSYLSALGAKFGQTVTPVHVDP